MWWEFESEGNPIFLVCVWDKHVWWHTRCQTRTTEREKAWPHELNGNEKTKLKSEETLKERHGDWESG